MRQFVLKNKNGAKYSLMDTSHWLSEPNGLGERFNSNYVQIGSTFVRTKKKTAPDSITGTVLISGGTQTEYELYNAFLAFAQHEPLELIYNPFGTEYSASVDIIKIDKGEVSANDGLLHIPVTYKRLTRWRRVITKHTDASEEDGKVYTYEYPYQYGGDVVNNVTIQSDTACESPCKIYIIGACKNPVWKHYVNGKLIETGALNVEIGANERIIIDTTCIPYSIKKFDNSGNELLNLYGNSDFSTKRFCFLEYGTNRFAVGHDGLNDLELAVEVQLEYESV